MTDDEYWDCMRVLCEPMPAAQPRPTVRPPVIPKAGPAPAPKAEPPILPPSATEQWTALVHSFVRRGMSQPEAVIAANRENAKLRLAYLDEVNRQPSPPKSESPDAAIDEWRRLISQHMAKHGVDRMAATMFVARANPELRRRVVEAANPKTYAQ